MERDDYDSNEKVLRQFDMNMAYRPYIDLARLDRWNEANKLGLNPPKEVETLLKLDKLGRIALRWGDWWMLLEPRLLELAMRPSIPDIA
uniref:Uncharacterized protein n=1 Tax=Chenopodium quinoa TaxID=63459 RepID=A0A803MNR2_CHEQI